jgi:uroporphyrinogen-III decarboxylase
MIGKMGVCGKPIDVDFGKAAAIFEQSHDRPVICGSADPVAVFYQGTPEKVYRATWKCLEECGERCFIAAGCEIPDGTPEENLNAQNQALKDFFEKV